MSRFWILWPLLVLAPSVSGQELRTVSGQELTIRRIGNAGVVLTDGAVTLLVDLPHVPGAFGYATYDPSELDPPGDVVSVITHAHSDHFAPDLFMERDHWRIMGPSNVVEGLPPNRVLDDDTRSIGAFVVVPIATPHAEGHRSYSIRWRGRAFHVTGDTEDGGFALAEPRLDILFITPWLACTLAESEQWPRADRTIVYHLRADGSDRLCGPAETLATGTVIRLTAAKTEGSSPLMN